MGAKIPELASSIEAGKSRKTQLESDLKSHKADRRTAKDSIAEATSIREKEKAVFDKDHADLTANLAATRKATAAIAKGMEGAFLQTSAADVLRNLVNSREGMTDSDRRDVLAFLAGGQQGEYAPASGEIVGVLKQMADTMAADDKDLVTKESGAVKDFDALIRSKEKEVSILTKSIETKTARVGELGVDIATMEADAGDTAEALEEDKKFGKDSVGVGFEEPQGGSKDRQGRHCGSHQHPGEGEGGLRQGPCGLDGKPGSNKEGDCGHREGHG